MKTSLNTIFLFILLMLLNIQSGAQTISFSIICHQTETNKSSIINQSDYKISKFKFYLSNIRLYNDNNIIDQEIYSYHLIDLLDTSKDKLIIKRNNNLTYNKIEFDLGIDSATNVSGALEGDLDPTNNMYWTWQSGYINLKFEGSIDDGVIREYHLGGYAYPNNALQKLSFKLNNSGITTIYIHLDDFIHSIPDSIPFKFMTPDSKAVYLSHLFAKCLSSEK